MDRARRAGAARLNATGGAPMILDLMRAGTRLAGRRDPQLTRGLVLAAVEGVLAALPWCFAAALVLRLAQHRLDDGSLAILAILMLASLLLRVVVAVAGMPMVFSGAYALMGDARLRVADHLRRLSLGWFARKRSGDLSARLTSDLELVENLWSHFLGAFVTGVTTAACLLLFLFALDARLAVAALASVPPALLMLFLTQRAAERSVPRLLEASSQAQAAILEYVQGISVIRSFGRFAQAWRKLDSTLGELHDAALDIESKPAPWIAGYGLVLEAGYLLMLATLVWWRQDSTSGAYLLIAALVLAAPVYRHLYDAGLATLMLRFARRSMKRIDEILDDAPIPDGDCDVPPPHGDIRFDHVSFAYDGADVLHDIDCVIPAGKVTAIVGASGAGKTTLVHLIARLWDVDKGAIRVGGMDVRALHEATLHRLIAMVFQDVVLFSGSVLDNIRLGRPHASEADAIEAARAAGADAFIRALPDGYHTRLDENGGSLSGGERQRISIARALLKDAPVLLLDEATANVDPSSEAQIQQALSHLARDRTVVVIAHRLRTVCTADQIIVLDDGRVTEQGTHDSLLARSGTYARLWAAQEQAANWRVG
jgi:ATP-binding cassette, subfamily B, bacterial IrtB/YbtQ